MCERYYLCRPMRELEEQIIEDCRLSDLNVSSFDFDELSGLLVLTIDNPLPGDLRRLEDNGWVTERAV